MHVGQILDRLEIADVLPEEAFQPLFLPTSQHALGLCQERLGKPAVLEKGLDEIRRTIREVEPPRPSTRITQQGSASTEAATNRHTEPARLASQLRGDLDWITMKALEKDRTRRYDTVMGLANDLRRHLRHEPVVEDPPSRAYRARQFVRRHRFGVGAAATLLLLLLAFGITMAVQAQRIARERDRANREAARASQEAEAARQVTEFMTGLFKVSDPGEARGNTITAREILDRGVQRIDTELVGQPLTQARMMTTMGEVYSALGLDRRAETLLRNALAVRQRLLGARAPETLRSLHRLGAVLMAQGHYAEAEPFAREALNGRRVVLGLDHPNTLESLNNLTGLLFGLGKWADAESGFRELLTARERVLGADDSNTLTAASNLASVLQVQGKLAEAETLYKRALTGFQKAVRRDHPRTLAVQFNLGTIAERQERWAEATEYYVAALEASRRVLGEDHPETLVVAMALSDVRFWQRRLDEAEALARDVLTRTRRALAPQHKVTASVLVRLGSVLNARGRYDEARPMLEEGLGIRRALAPDHWYVAAAECELGESLRGVRALDTATPLAPGRMQPCARQHGAEQRRETRRRQPCRRLVRRHERANEGRRVAGEAASVTCSFVTMTLRVSASWSVTDQNPSGRTLIRRGPKAFDFADAFALLYESARLS